MSRYIVRLNNNLACFYHTQENTILLRVYQAGKWSKAKGIIGNVRENFSVNVSTKIYLFCQDINGSIILCTGEDYSFSKRTILESTEYNPHNILFNALIKKEGMLLIYNTPAGDGHYLMRQRLTEGKWSKAERIDKIPNQSRELFQIQHISPEHVLLFYQTQSGEIATGYRELNMESCGKFNSYYSGSQAVYDQSILTTNKAVHTAYVLKGLFSSQLIYRKKEDEEFGSPVIISEGTKIDFVHMFFAEDNLYIVFRGNSWISYVISENNGESFSKPKRYGNKFCLEPVKAIYLTNDTQRENASFSRELIVDAAAPWDIQMLPDIYENFYPVSEPEPAREKVEKESEEYSEIINALRQKVSEYEMKLEDKDRQILMLQKMIKPTI